MYQLYSWNTFLLGLDYMEGSISSILFNCLISVLSFSPSLLSCIDAFFSFKIPLKNLLALSLLLHSSQVFCCQIEIKELDDFAQAAFHGYKSLNRIQSRIFQAVYYTNENILVGCILCSCIYTGYILRSLLCYVKVIYMFWQVCAPTGAGKTNIAMISILHEVYSCSLHLASFFSSLDFPFMFFSFVQK